MSPDAAPSRPPATERRGVDPLPVGPAGLRCSAKGCRVQARHDLQWNNPRIHTADRRKHWLACPEHLDSLRGFLSARNFLRDVNDLPDQPPVERPTGEA